MSSWTFTRVLRYAAGGASAAWVAIHFYKAGGNIHRAEISMLDSIKKLHLYPPPSPLKSEINSKLVETLNCPEELKNAVIFWFLESDAREKRGLTRGDIIDKFEEWGLVLSAEETRSFLARGRGRGPEEQRLSSVSLSGVLTFLDLSCRGDLSETIKKIKGEDLEILALEKEIRSLEGRQLSDAEEERLVDLKKRLAFL